uniref:Uncharacterized protein n=1 Tax=Arundo donax TaxID=35708 RepID=A0A0A9A151_ARUDO
MPRSSTSTRNGSDVPVECACRDQRMK